MCYPNRPLREYFQIVFVNPGLADMRASFRFGLSTWMPTWLDFTFLIIVWRSEIIFPSNSSPPNSIKSYLGGFAGDLFGRMTLTFTGHDVIWFVWENLYGKIYVFVMSYGYSKAKKNRCIIKDGIYLCNDCAKSINKRVELNPPQRVPTTLQATCGTWSLASILTPPPNYRRRPGQCKRRVCTRPVHPSRVHFAAPTPWLERCGSTSTIRPCLLLDLLSSPTLHPTSGWNIMALRISNAIYSGV